MDGMLWINDVDGIMVVWYGSMRIYGVEDTEG